MESASLLPIPSPEECAGPVVGFFLRYLDNGVGSRRVVVEVQLPGESVSADYLRKKNCGAPAVASNCEDRASRFKGNVRRDVGVNILHNKIRETIQVVLVEKKTHIVEVVGFRSSNRHSLPYPKHVL